MFNGNTLAQIEPPLQGIHLFWTGLHSWIYSPEGWHIQRRKFSGKHKLTCETLTRQIIANLRNEKEIRIPFGWVSYRTAFLGNSSPFSLSSTNIEIFTLELDIPTHFIQIHTSGKVAFSFAMFQGKVVAKVSPPAQNNTSVQFYASAIDKVVTYFMSPVSISYCIPESKSSEDDNWDNVPFLLKGLQLPLRELNPGLQNFDDEYQEAKSRLLPGEDIDEDVFRELLDKLRTKVQQPSPPRPIDKVLLLREDPNARFEELSAVAPLLSLISHPKWRRVLGFSWFDEDPSLQPGQTYEYRITGFFPIEDHEDQIYGFHTIPSNTSLPICFFLDNILLRFPQPLKVELAPGTAQTGQQQLSRRGVPLKPQNQFFWLSPSLQDWSVVIDFPSPVEQIQLELQEGHELKYQAFMNFISVGNVQALPAGSTLKLAFQSPINQLRLNGEGFLFTIRVLNGANGMQPMSLVLPPVSFNNYPRPTAPASLEAENLQKLLARSALGFELSWPPTLQNGLLFWPQDELTPPPLDSTLYQIEHRELPNPNWTPILPDENWVFGHRRGDQEKVQIKHGMDLMQLFPEHPTPDGSTQQEMTWNDVFDFPIDGISPLRPVPDLGTKHQYRIRAIDVIGRPSTNWRESNAVELQKHMPPPVPIAVKTRKLVQDAPDMTTEEQAILGTDNNLILLHWEWGEEQSALDPYAKEFRIYVNHQALDSLEANLTSVDDLTNGRFEITLDLEAHLSPDALKGTFINIGDYPFYIESHEGGQLIKMILRRRLQDENAQLSGPHPGPVSLPVYIGSEKMQAPAWSARIGIVPITGDTSYVFEIRNQLQLSPAQIRDEIWVGVSTADDQPYIDDPLSPDDDRPGNESPIVPIKVQARYWGRPEFDIPPPLEAIPQLVTPEPEDGPVNFELDITQYFDAPNLAGLQQIRLERTTVGAVFGNYYVSEDERIMARAIEDGQVDEEVNIPNPDDKTQIIAAFREATSSQLADRYAVFLAGSHPYRTAFFEPVTPDPIPVGPYSETLQPFGTRYIYSIRGGNAAGLISEGDAVAKVIVRVPSLKPGGQPERVLPPSNRTPGILQLFIPNDEAVTHHLCFREEIVVDAGGPLPESALLRIANRPDLFPDRMIRLRTPSGGFIEPLVTDLSGPEVIEATDRHKIVEIAIEEAPGTTWRVWACSLTRDGIPSKLAGPWRIAMPVPT